MCLHRNRVRMEITNFHFKNGGRASSSLLYDLRAQELQDSFFVYQSGSQNSSGDFMRPRVRVNKYLVSSLFGKRERSCIG